MSGGGTPVPARLVVVVAVAFSSLSALLIRLSTAPAPAIAAWRMILSFLMMTAVVAISRRQRSSPPAVTINPRVVALLALSGLFLALHFATWIASLSLTSVTHSTVLVTMHPVIVLFGGFFFLHEKIDRARLLPAVGAVFGAAILAVGGSSSGRQPTLAGDLLAVAGAVAVSGYLVIGSWARRHVGAGVYSVVVYGIAAAVLTGFAGFTGQELLSYSPRDYALFAALAFFCTILGHGLINWGLKYVPAAEVSMYIVLEPVFATVMAMIWLDELPGVVTATGGLLVLLSLMVVTRRNRTAFES
ncbi:MAG: DMT family transporter [Alkalispirochaeta sp.]